MRKVYLLKESESNYYKIGISKNPSARIKQLQTGSAGKISLSKTYASEYASKIESTLHRRYTDSRIRGEWFTLTERQVNSFISECEKLEYNFKILDKSKDKSHITYNKRV